MEKCPTKSNIIMRGAQFFKSLFFEILYTSYAFKSCCYSNAIKKSRAYQ